MKEKNGLTESAIEIGTEKGTETETEIEMIMTEREIEMTVTGMIGTEIGIVIENETGIETEIEMTEKGTRTTDPSNNVKSGFFNEIPHLELCCLFSSIKNKTVLVQVLTRLAGTILHNILFIEYLALSR